MTTDPYRVAYESALAEITEITTKFEQLRARKDKIASLIAVLQPMFTAEGSQPEAVSAPSVSAQLASAEQTPEGQVVAEMAPAASGEPANYSYLDVPNPLPQGDGDPFQRRGRGAFRFRGLAAQRAY